MAKTTNREMDSLKDGAKALSDLSTEAIDAIRELVQEVRDETLDLVEDSRRHATDMGNVAVRAISQHPLRAVCIALGVGCLIGMSMNRR